MVLDERRIIARSQEQSYACCGIGESGYILTTLFKLPSAKKSWETKLNQQMETWL